MIKILKHCKFCNEEYEDTVKHSDLSSNYCSNYCYDSDLDSKHTRICKFCKNTFIPKKTRYGNKIKYSQQLYCSDECRQKERDMQHEKQCKNCHKIFIPLKYLDNDNALRYSRSNFCSLQCEQEFRLKSKTMKCKLCGNLFTPKCLGIGSNGSTYFSEFSFCSITCYENYKDLQHFRYCKYCGKKFFLKRIGFDNRGGVQYECTKYCSDECFKLSYNRDKDKIQKQREETNIKKYGIKYPVQRYSNKVRISKYNQNFAQKLKENNIIYDVDNSNNILEYELDGKLFDFHITDSNILIELNPTYTHTTAPTSYNKDNSKFEMYHKNKTHLAEENGLVCIHVWQWDNWVHVINYLKYLLRIDQNLFDFKIKLLDQQQVEAISEYTILNNSIETKQLKNTKNTFSYYGYYVDDALTYIFICKHTTKIVEILSILHTSQYKQTSALQNIMYFLKQIYNTVIFYYDLSKPLDFVITDKQILHKDSLPNKYWTKEKLGNVVIKDNILQELGFIKYFDLGPYEYEKLKNMKITTNIDYLKYMHYLPIFDCGTRIYELK